MRRRLFAIGIALAVACMTNAARGQTPDLQRGLRNYQDIIAGKKKLDQLSALERQEVLQVARRMKSSRRSEKSRECREALERAEEAAQELASSTRALLNCVESEDFEDDCSSEFSRVRSDHDDYEDAVSDVQSYCT